MGRLLLGRLRFDLLFGRLLFDRLLLGRRCSATLHLDVLRRHGILRRGRSLRYGGRLLGRLRLRGRLRWCGCGLRRAGGSPFGQFGQGERPYIEGIGRVIFFLTEDR